MNTRTILIGAMLAVSGCGNNLARQFESILEDKCLVKFCDGKLGEHFTDGFDASFLHAAIKRHFDGNKNRYTDMDDNQFASLFPAVYFVSLKSKDGVGVWKPKYDKGILAMEIDSIEYRRSTNVMLSEMKNSVRRKTFTFFMITPEDKVEILSVDLSRNPSRGHGVGRNFIFSSVDCSISIWDSFMPDKNKPESIFGKQYKKILAVMTDRPFNYMENIKVERLLALEKMGWAYVFRLCWRTPTCMIFIPEQLLQGKNSDGIGGQ